MPTLRLPFTPYFFAPPSAEERAAVEASTSRKAGRGPQTEVQTSLKCTRLPFSFPHVGVTQAAPPLPRDVAAEGWTLDHHRVKVGRGRAAYSKAQRLLQQWRHFDLGWASTNAPPVQPGAGVVVTAKTLFAWSCSPLRISYVEEAPLSSGQLPPWAPPPPPRPRGSTQLHTSCGGARDTTGGSDSSSSSRSASAAAAGAPSPPARRGSGGRAQQQEAAAATANAADEVAVPPQGRRYAFAGTTLEGHTIRGEERFAVAWNQEDDSVWYEIYTLSRPGHWITTLTHLLLRAYQRKFAADSMAAMVREMAAGEQGARKL